MMTIHSMKVMKNERGIANLNETDDFLKKEKR